MSAKDQPLDIQACRSQFPALSRRVADQPAVFFDGPAGSQTPQSVIDAVADSMAHRNANHGGLFATSIESDADLREAHRAVADLLGADDPDCVAFGPNMTTLTFALSRALARTWNPGDEVLLSRLEHDANVTPWVLAADDAGATVRYVEFDRTDCTLDLDDLRSKLTPRTRLVAIGCASNAVGSINPVAEICDLAKEAGALTFLDAVHYAPHALMDVTGWGCDFLCCSAYKFFGPHIGVMWGRRALLEELTPYKLRPASDDLPDRWMTGTQSHEGIAGTAAAVEYLADLGRAVTPDSGDRRAALRSAFSAIGDYERSLTRRLLAGLAELDAVKVWGITDPVRLGERLPTVSITHARILPTEMAAELGRQGIFVWHGNYYALPLTEALDLEPEGMVRIGLLHYNTEEEVDRLLDALSRM